MKPRSVEINKHTTGFYTVSIDGKIVKNSRSCPPGASTFASRKDAKEYLENEGIVTCQCYCHQ